MAKNASSVMVAKMLGRNPPERTDAVLVWFIAWVNRSKGPSNNTKVTNTPTAMKATSLIIDSLAIASIRPS